MDYAKKESEYKTEGITGEKYYIGQNSPEEEKKQETPTFQQVFYNIPKGGSIAARAEFHDGVIYFPSLDTHVYALDAKTGQMIWKFRTGGPSISAPLVHNNHVYFGSNNEFFYCLNLDGQLLWKKHLGDIIVSYPSGFGDKIFAAAGKYLFCLSEKGQEIWKFRTGDGLLVLPKIVNNRVFIGSYDRHAYGLDAETGRLLWKFGTGGPLGSPIIFSENKALVTVKRSWEKMPEAKDPRLYFTSADNYVYCTDQDGNLIWKLNCGMSLSSGVTGDNGKIFVGSVPGYLHAIDALAGKFLWKFRANNMITAGTAIKNDELYIGSWDHKMYCLAANGEKVWDFLTGGPIAAEAVIAGDNIYFGSADTFFYCMNTRKRNVEWTFQCGFGMPEVLSNKISQALNAFVEYDKKIFKVWRPETIKSTQHTASSNYSIPSGFSFGGEQIYSSSNSYKAENRHIAKKRQYNK